MYGGDPQHQQRPPPGPSGPPMQPRPTAHQFHHQHPPHDFPRGQHPRGPPPPPPQLIRQPSASSTTINPPAHDYRHPQQHPTAQPPFPPMQQPFDAHGDGFAMKRMRKVGQRRAVDYTSTVVRYIQTRTFQRDSRDQTTMQPDPVAAIDMLPPVAYEHNPSTGFAAKFVHTSLNKNRCPINQVLWTPSGRRLITGSQSGEFTLWNGQSFNFEMILQAHEQAVRSMVWSYNENWMVTGDDGGTIKYWLPNMNNVKANKSAHKESVRGLRTDLKFCSCSDDTTVKVWDFARCQEERLLSGHGWDVKCVDWHPSKSLLVSGGKDNLVKLWDAKSGKELCSFHGHKNIVLCVKWNQNGNWVLTSSKDQIIKLYDIRVMKELESFRGHMKDVNVLAWHPFHEEYFVSGGFDGSIFHWLVGHENPQIEIQNGHDNSIWDLAWHPIGYLLCSGGQDNATKFWCRNRPGDPARDKVGVGPNQGFGEPNPAIGGRVNIPYQMPEPPTTPGSFGPGLARNEGTIPGIGAAMPLAVPSFSSSLGEQKPPPPPPHPSALLGNQPQPYQQMPQQMSTMLQPPNMPQPNAPNLPFSQSHLPRPPQMQLHNMPSNASSIAISGQVPSQMGHFMGNMPPGSIPGGLHNIQNKSNPISYQQGGSFNRPSIMPGINPYQQQPGFGNPSGAPPHPHQ